MPEILTAWDPDVMTHEDAEVEDELCAIGVSGPPVEGGQVLEGADFI